MTDDVKADVAVAVDVDAVWESVTGAVIVPVQTWQIVLAVSAPMEQLTERQMIRSQIAHCGVTPVGNG
jgi:hypothetical protein